MPVTRVLLDSHSIWALLLHVGACAVLTKKYSVSGLDNAEVCLLQFVRRTKRTVLRAHYSPSRDGNTTYYFMDIVVFGQ